jgi:hypothetical protein
MEPLGGLRSVNRTLLVLFLFTAIVFSQPRLEMGVRIDAPIVGPLTTYSSPTLCANLAPCGLYESAPLHPAIGLSVSVPIAPRLRVRFDPTYQRIGLSDSSYEFLNETTANSPVDEVVGKTSATANRWQFPALIEARLLRHLHFGIGPAVSLLTAIGATTKVKIIDPFPGAYPYVYTYISPVSRQAIAGAAAALEFPFRFRNVTLAPELRYKRWFDKHYGGNWTMDEFTVGIAIRLSR